MNTTTPTVKIKFTAKTEINDIGRTEHLVVRDDGKIMARMSFWDNAVAYADNLNRKQFNN
jgi:hypothetical protein